MITERQILFFVLLLPLNLIAQHKKVETFFDEKKKIGIREAFYVLEKNHHILDSLYQSFYENGNLKSQGYYVKNKPNGKWAYYFENGKVSMEGNLKDGEYEGVWTYYYENGNTNMKGEVNHGSREGEWIYFYENGKIKSIGHYKKNNKEGTWKYFYEDGAFKAEAVYENDKGLYQEYYQTGELKSEGNIIDGKSNGLWKYYYKSGKLKAEGYEKNGVKEGLWKYYHESGTVSSEGIYMNGKAEGNWKHYYESGAVSAQGEEKEGQKNGYWKLYYEDGTLKGEGEFIKGEGPYKEYYESGKLKSEGVLKDDKKEGPWKYYYESGALEGECTFKNGEGMYSGYYENGKNKMQGRLENGNRVGVWTLYNEDGSLAGYYQTYYEKDAQVFRPINENPKDTVKADTLKSKMPNIRAPKRKPRVFTKKINEFRTVIASGGPLGLMEGQIPLWFEYYIQERLGFEIGYIYYRDPFLRSFKNLPVNQAFYRGFSVSLRQKFYQRDRDNGMYYFGSEFRYYNLGYGARVYDSTITTNEAVYVQLSEDRFDFCFLIGDRIMKEANKGGFTIDIYAGVGIGYRIVSKSWEGDNRLYERPFFNISKKDYTIPIRFGINIGFAKKSPPPYYKNQRN